MPYVRRLWTPELRTRARDMQREGRTPYAIAVSCGLTVVQVNSYFYNLRRGHNSERTDTAPSQYMLRRPSEAVLAERDRRNAAPRDLTAELCGDPPKGYSALDHKQSRG